MLIFADANHDVDVENFPRAKAEGPDGKGLDGFIAKASEGMDFKDSSFDYRAVEAPAATLLFGAYHYYQPGDDPIAQAQWFFNIVKNFMPMALGIDLEPVGGEAQGKGWAALTPDQNVANLKAFLAELKKWIKGGKLLIYAGADFIDRYLTGMDLSDDCLWVTDPSNDNPKVPKCWAGKGQTWTLFQYSFTGNLPGIVGDVDLSRFMGDATDFIDLLYCQEA